MKKIFVFLLIASIFLACHDSNVKPSALSSFNITNVVIGGNTLTLNNTGSNILNNSYTQCTLFAGESQIKLDDTSIHPQQVYYDQTISTISGSYYSLFLTGASSTQIDNILIKENYSNYTDSVAGVRFINLSPGSNPVSVDITGKTNGSEVTNLAYKAFTSFNKYSATTANSSYNFEFRDVVTGTLIATYSLSPPVFKNVTLALTGLVNSNPTVISINEY
jgi:hypothetical protein